MKIITGIGLVLCVNCVQAVDIKTDKALEDELAYLHAEYIYSANKKLQNVNDVASAVFVISQEEIRRSGATVIPEVLRMVPGMQVAQIDANKWAISIRGLNARYSTELLVLIDGRAVYTPVFSGVFWHREDTPLADIERIEVIRGAGAAVWGANAVDGVINIITKNAKDTQGLLLSVGGGNQESGFGHIRYGGKIGEDFQYRIYGKGIKRNNNISLTGENSADDMENYQGGFKTQWQLSKNDSLTVQGDIYHSRTGDAQNIAITKPPYVLNGLDIPGRYKGGNIQTRWQHTFSDTSEMALQVYYKHDDTSRVIVVPSREHEKTFDVDFQHRFKLNQHNVIWGLGYRNFDFHFGADNPKISAGGKHENLHLFSSFVQDEITLLEDTLHLTVGTRLEHNDYTGIEVQPNIRLLWTPSDTQSVWGSISRAVRTPSIGSRTPKTNFTNPLPAIEGLPAISFVDGTENFKSENVLDYELGYRFQPNKKLSLEIDGFYNRYNRIQNIEVLDAEYVSNADGAYLKIPINLINQLKGETLGLELTGQWQFSQWLKLRASYSLVKDNLYAKAALQQVHFKASFNLPYNLEIDPTLRYVSGINNDNPPAYTAVDLRMGWKPIKNVELSIVGQNLFDRQHPEFYDNAYDIRQTQIRRSLFGKIQLSF